MRLRTAQPGEERLRPQRRLPTVREEWVVTLFSVWFVFGLFIDGWAHNHLSAALETFFTPWHAIFYSGYLVLALSLVAMTWRNKRRTGGDWLTSIPVGYGWSLLGTALFAFGGVGDMAWHILFGIEADVEALLSPTHLLLAIGMFLMITGNVRAWWARPTPIGVPRLVEQLPMILSLGMTLSIITFMTQFAHYMEVYASVPRPHELQQSMSIALGIAGYLLQMLILMGCIFTVLKRARLARGALFILLVLNVVAMGWMRDGFAFLPAAILTAFLAEYSARNLYPLDQHLREFRAFAFAIPAVFFALYFVTLALQSGIWWTVHVWAGAIVLVGIAGILLSFVAVPMEERI